MDTSLTALTDALKQLFIDLKPNQKTFSFLLLIGKTDQGKSTLLRQSSLEHIEVSAERAVSLHYNADGIILELSESWIHQSNSLFEQALKQINRSHHALKLTGILFAIDVNPLFTSLHSDLTVLIQEHAALLSRFSKAFSSTLDVAILFTKLDGIAGFSDFFQQDNRLEEKEPLGFSIDWGKKEGKIANNYNARFNHLLEALSQEILPKVHPARSSVKRMLIREFPLQLSKFHFIIQALLKQIPPNRTRIRAIYFTSGEQGGISQDNLNEKICEEYALTLPNAVPQSSNYRPYFIDEALHQFQTQTAKPIPKPVLSQKYLTRIAASVVGLSLAFIVHHHISSSHVLDDVTKELLAYDAEHQQHPEKHGALFHLSKASDKLSSIKLHSFSPPTLQHLQTTLKSNTNTQLHNKFIPKVLHTVEHVLTSPEQKPAARYEALKTYIALNEPVRRDTTHMIRWFEQAWADEEGAQNQQELLKKTILDSGSAVSINQQLVRDTRNYLNAIPAGYLFYALLKTDFPKDTQKLKWDGFVLGASEVPVYYTRQSYETLVQQIPEKAARFESENWVLERQDLNKLSNLLEQAYAFDYHTWWKIFLKDTHPQASQNYTEARERLEALEGSDSLRELARFIQAQTRPDLDKQNSVFNQTVSTHYTSLTLVSETSLKDLSQDIRELKQFLSTLAVVYDDGRTAFNIAKTRFQNEGPRNALSAFHLTAKQLPEPVGLWAKQIADDAWFLLMSDAKKFINTQWQTYIYPEYHRAILNHYPFDPKSIEEVALHDFDHFFSRHGVLSKFAEQYIKPFLDTSKPEWPLKEADEHVLPISENIVRQFVRANIITAMFFPKGYESSHVEFSLHKMNLDPVISKLELSIGSTRLKDTQSHESAVDFEWPESDAELVLHSIEGGKYELAEDGPWAFFKLLDKLNVLMDKNDSSSLHVLFEVNGDSGRYLLKTANGLNPFTPGILTDFELKEEIV